MSNLKLVSIIVPVYNVANYLAECIYSIKNQSYRNIEIILIDDGSTDDSLSICLELARQDNRIIVLNKENGGQASARNLGLNIARGDYIAFIDSDDTISLDLIEKNIDILTQNANIDVVQFPICRNYGLPTVFKDFASTGFIAGTEDLYRQWIECNRISWIVCNKIFKKSVFINLHFKEGIVYEDNDMVAEVLSKINILYISDVGMYYYHSRVNSTTTSTHTLKKEQDTQKVSINIYSKILIYPSLALGKVTIESRILNVATSIQRNYQQVAVNYLPKNFKQNISIKNLRLSKLPLKEKIKLLLFKVLNTNIYFNILAK